MTSSYSKAIELVLLRTFISIILRCLCRLWKKDKKTLWRLKTRFAQLSFIFLDFFYNGLQYLMESYCSQKWPQSRLNYLRAKFNRLPCIVWTLIIAFLSWLLWFCVYWCAQFIQRSRGHYFQPFRDIVKPVSQSTPWVFPALNAGFSECLPSLENAISEFPGPLYQNKVKYSANDMEMIFYFHANKTHFLKECCTLRLILKVRVF